MKITICIGSSCHIKGSRQVVEQLQALVSENGLMNRIELTGTFCIGQCQSGVNVLIDGERFSVTPDTTTSFFNNEVMPRLGT